MTGRRRTLAALSAVLLLAALTGCVELPEKGPVVETEPSAKVAEQQAAAIDAIPPQEGDAALDIVNGFLDAMTAYPVQANVARQFLAREAQAAWNPDDATITYGDITDPSADAGSRNVSVTLGDPESLDGRGGWQGPLPADQRRLTFRMVVEDGEYRIANAPDALIVPAQWFSQRFRQASLYFFDRTAQILVPEPVFVPRGEQLATTLIDGLLAGPGERLSGVARSFLPPNLTVGLSVPISEEGVADITLVGDSGQQNPEVIEKMLAQLVWTLRQEPSISAIRLQIGDERIRLPDGVAEYRVDAAPEYDPTGYQASRLLYGLVDGLLVSGELDTLAPAEGPFGDTGYGLRSVAVNLPATLAAGVTDNGRSVLLAPVRAVAGEEAPQRAIQVVSGATRLLRPSWDFADRLWMVDRAPSGARVILREGERLRGLQVPGVTGQDVRSFVVSRDATRFVAVVRRDGVDRLLLGRVQVDFQGRVREAVGVRTMTFEDADPVRVTDIAWTSPTSVALLSEVVPGELFEVRTVVVDGAPAGVEALSTTVNEAVLGLAGSPVPGARQYAVTDEGVVDLLTSRVVELEGRPASLGYVG
ncbi:LpqB family beta-propeller domain-containing protein [Nocardioides sp. cx-173]|uniref:LpqB family beta-propeller domain-containing protein n=1 Tax=Nocardioides sp. cx-173 TaxID=2898796 RepID=UPI001E2CFD6F|nr:LpqB family beta-propeller domain-containing protein [Nocardioides sp. cx-173]MCD4525353.1 LpqB family beta-propeller domain-containing protein [Nocardioides sp. cx-173]UGB40851.1 LpqB family beta-propeller domain-containing protein [Nocardioides sp. cx-173]